MNVWNVHESIESVHQIILYRCDPVVFCMRREKLTCILVFPFVDPPHACRNHFLWNNLLVKRILFQAFLNLDCFRFLQRQQISIDIKSVQNTCFFINNKFINANKNLLWIKTNLYEPVHQFFWLMDSIWKVSKCLMFVFCFQRSHAELLNEDRIDFTYIIYYYRISNLIEMKSLIITLHALLSFQRRQILNGNSQCNAWSRSKNKKLQQTNQRIVCFCDFNWTW